MSFCADLETYVHGHRPHSPLTADATEPAWNGYLLTVACPCGVVFERWIMPLDAELDLLYLAQLNLRTFERGKVHPTSGCFPRNHAMSRFR